RETYNKDIESMISYIEEKIRLPIYLTYNEFAAPDWRSLLAKIVDDGYKRILTSYYNHCCRIKGKE
ncbi:MAG: CbiX/SirB N-terminal domain-containing protein, partial [Candidatus Micrarchaeaceae archaeon]